MNGHEKRPTQEERILQLLRERGTQGVKSWEIPNDLHILQYNARIFGLRNKGHNIVNKNDTFYLMPNEPYQESLI